MKIALYLLPVFALLSLSHISTSQSLDADFSANRQSGCNEISVQFINESSASEPVQYLWDLGNGQHSSLQNPSVIYDTPGAYSISLTISKDGSSDTMTKENYVVVYNSPTANFYIENEADGCASYEVNFVDSSTPGDAPITAWQYDFDDGNTADSAFAQNTYTFQNQFSPILTVTDTNGCSDYIQKENLISVYKPAANFEISQEYSCEGSLRAQFINYSTGSSHLSFSWSFGDETSSQESNPLHSYTQDGIYDVSLTVNDAHNCTDSLTKTGAIDFKAAQAKFTGLRDTVCLGEEVEFINQSVNAVSYNWDFGNGTYSNIKNPKHSFSEYGNHIVRLEIESAEGCTESFEKTIHVQQVIADFEQDIQFSCNFPTKVNYTNKSLNADSLFWNFGDTYFSTNENPTILYTKQGIYNHTLTVKSKYGCTDTKTVEDALEVAYPHAYFTPNDWEEADNIGGCVPNNITFTDKSIYNAKNDSIISYYWNFGNGSDSFDKNPQHTYYEVGQYTMYLEVLTAAGCKSKFYAQALAGEPQFPDFIKNNDDAVCASEEVEFTDVLQNEELINKWIWYFGDNNKSAKQNPKHLYTDTGYMNVTLKVYHNGCSSSIEKENFIYIKGPYVQASMKTTCSLPFAAEFDSKILGAESFSWNFGDGTKSDENNPAPTHNYSDRGNYTYKLSGINNTTGCAHEVIGTAKIRKPEALFTLQNDTGCVNDDVFLSGNESKDADFFYFNDKIGKYLWDFGDGSPKVITSIPHIHQYNKKGATEISLTVKDIHGCSNSLKKTFESFKPKSNFELTELTGCLPFYAEFNNSSESELPISSYLWNFGDGENSQEANPTHSYTQSGVFDVELIITDALSCKDTLKKISYVSAQKPIPNFSALGRKNCTGAATRFNPNSMPEVNQWLWDFGDGTQSFEKSPIHTYKSAGTYNVSLMVTDQRGCDSTLIKTGFVEIQNYPSPNFFADETEHSCYPSEIKFISEADYSEANKRLWRFGSNNAASELPNPTHTFILPGKYDISLTVSSSFGCTDSLTLKDYITVHGPYAEIIAPDSVCRSERITLSMENKKDIFDWEWIFDDGTSSQEEAPEHTFYEFGTHKAYLQIRTDSLKTCDKILNKPINVRSFKAEISAENGLLTGCRPFRVNFLAANTQSVQSRWIFDTGDNSNELAPVYTFIEDGSFEPQVIITDIHGCLDTATTQITVHPLPVMQISEDTVLCVGESTLLFAQGAKSYQWYPNIDISNNSGSRTTARPETSRMYFVEGTDQNGCSSQESVYIQVIPKPSFTLQDTSVVIGESIEIGFESDEFSDYRWYAPHYISNPYVPIISVQPEESGSYELSVKDTSGCYEISEKMWIEVLHTYTLDMPDAFSPNNDGINDYLHVKGHGIQELISFEIFNRYGERIFYSSDIDQGWDGSLSGRVQNIESYKYQVIARMHNNEIISKTGTIILLK